MKVDIHNFAQQVQGAILWVRNDVQLDKKNKKRILEFVDHLIAEGTSKPRIAKYAYTLRQWAHWLNKDFEKVKKEDIAQVVTKIQLQDHYSAWTKHTFKVMIRRFFRWLKKTDDDYPEEVKWLKSRISRSEQRLPGEGELLVEEDIRKLLAVTEHPRDKAFISMLWESGCRVGEIGSLRICNVTVDEKGIVITVSGKTGSRKIRLVASTEALVTWLNNHPLKHDPNAALWVNIGNTNHNKPMLYRNIVKTVQVHFKKAGIKKRCNPHIFRHSRATFMANHLTEFQMNQYFGWIQGSDMASTYVHMSGREVDQAILTLNGIADPVQQRKESPLVPQKCPRCAALNGFDSSYCSRCACILDVLLQVEAEQKVQMEQKVNEFGSKLVDVLAKNPDVLKKVLEQLKAMV